MASQASAAPQGFCAIHQSHSTNDTFSWAWGHHSFYYILLKYVKDIHVRAFATVESTHAVNHFRPQPPAGTGMPRMAQQPVMFAQPMMRPPFGAAAAPGTQVSLNVHKIMALIDKYKTIIQENR